MVRHVVQIPCKLELEQSNDTAKVFALLLVVHLCHIVCDVLEPCLAEFASRHHIGELLADHGLLNQSLAEYLALMSPFPDFFSDVTGATSSTTAHDPALSSKVSIWLSLIDINANIPRD